MEGDTVVKTTGLRQPDGSNGAGGAVSSAVEHLVDIEGVTGSIPVPPTSYRRRQNDGRTQLYRHFDADGRLLYVGISLSVVSRLAQHRESAKWFSRISKVTVESYETREDALDAENNAIARENPIFNRKRPPSYLYGPKLDPEQDLPLYDHTADCPKCGYDDDISIRWFPAMPERRRDAHFTSPEHREHIRITCNECEYQWSEATLDSSPQEPETK